MKRIDIFEMRMKDILKNGFVDWNKKNDLAIIIKIMKRRGKKNKLEMKVM
jgi:hypothetical protein